MYTGFKTIPFKCTVPPTQAFNKITMHIYLQWERNFYTLRTRRQCCEKLDLIKLVLELSTKKTNRTEIKSGYLMQRMNDFGYLTFMFYITFYLAIKKTLLGIL